MLTQDQKEKHSIPAAERIIKDLVRERYYKATLGSISFTAILAGINQFIDILIKLHIWH